MEQIETNINENYQDQIDKANAIYKAKVVKQLKIVGGVVAAIAPIALGSEYGALVRHQHVGMACVCCVRCSSWIRRRICWNWWRTIPRVGLALLLGYDQHVAQGTVLAVMLDQCLYLQS